MATPFIQMQGIVKRFPGVIANDQVDLTIYPGEIHALLGENGSGKSTLMSVLDGLYQPNAGRIIIDGEEHKFGSPRDAIACGIGMIHQHFKLVEPFTVAENIIMGAKNGDFWLSTEKIKQDIAAFGAKYGLHVNPDAYVWQLSVGEKQRVEILRILYQGSRLLIMDEPTAVLTPPETAELFRNLRRMTEQGCAVIFITHKLNEVMELADRVTVLRAGRVTGSMERSQLNPNQLVQLMVGRNIADRSEPIQSEIGPVVLKVDQIEVFNDMGRPGLRALSLSLREGEILGLAGVTGNGQRELAEAISGLRHIESGAIHLHGEDITNLNPSAILNHGVSYVPEDRLGMGLVPDLNILENLLLKNYQKPKYSGRWLLHAKAIEENAVSLVQKYNVKTPSLYQPVKILSGGNLQRLLLAREISTVPRLMIVVYPSRGLDIGATEDIHKLLLALKANHTAILLISEDLDELVALSDRIGVLFNGRLVGEFPAHEVDLDKLGLLMAGSSQTNGGEPSAI